MITGKLGRVWTEQQIWRFVADGDGFIVLVDSYLRNITQMEKEPMSENIGMRKVISEVLSRGEIIKVMRTVLWWKTEVKR